MLSKNFQSWLEARFSCSNLTALLYHFVQFGRPLSHPIFSDTGFERFKYFLIFWDFSKNQKSQPLAEFIEMIQYTKYDEHLGVFSVEYEREG